MLLCCHCEEGGTRVFERVEFEGNTLVWDYQIKSVKDFKGYYHWHQCGEILYVHEGQGIVVLNNHTYPIRKGMLFFFQPYQLHHVYAEVHPDTPYERNIFYVEPIVMDRYLEAFPHRRAFFSRLWKGRNQQQVFDLSSSMDQLDWVYRSYHQSRSRVGGEWEESVLFLLQLLNVMDQQNDGEQASQPHLVESRQLRHAEKMMHWIEEHYIDEIRLDHMANDIHLSKSYASRIFRKKQEAVLRTTSQPEDSSRLIFCWKRQLFPLMRLADGLDFPMDLISFNYFASRREPLRYSIGSILNAAADIKSHEGNC